MCRMNKKNDKTKYGLLCVLNIYLKTDCTV